MKKFIPRILRTLPSRGRDLPAEDQNTGAWKHGKNYAQSWVQLCSHVIWRKTNRRTSGQTVFLMDEVIFRKWECNWLYILNVISKANSLSITFSSVQSLSRVWLFVTLWIAVLQASVAITKCWSLPKLMSIELVMPSSHLILCGPPNPSQHQALFHYLSLPPKRHQPTATGITRDRALTMSEAHVFNSLWKNFPIYVIAE